MLRDENMAVLDELAALAALTAQTEASRQALIADRTDLEAELATLEMSLENTFLLAASTEQDLSRSEERLALAEAARTTAVAVARAADSRAIELSRRLADAEDRSNNLSSRIDEMSEAVLTAYEAVETIEDERDGLRVALAEQRGVSSDLETHLLGAMAAAVDLSAERDQLLVQADVLNLNIETLEQDLVAQHTARLEVENTLTEARAISESLTLERDTLLVEGAALSSRIVGLQSDILENQEIEHGLVEELREADTAIDGLVAERDLLIAQSDALNQEIVTLHAGIADQQAAELALQDALQNAELTVDEVSAARDLALVQVAALDGEISAVRADLREQIAVGEDRDLTIRNMAGAAADLSTERNLLRDDNGVLLGQIAALEGRIIDLAVYQEETFSQLRQAIDDHVWAVEEGLAVTGLDIEAIIEDIYGPEFYGTGGPLIPLLDEHIAGQPGWADAVASIVQVDRAIELRDVANQLPIGFPVDSDVPVSSGFGPRRDPLNGGGAMHQGLDFDGERGDEVRASGPGTVIMAEWYSGYGRTVEIDHGFGLVSRYAHLQEILVEEGQPIGYSEPIGLMGSSGRTTGTHLHYEVLVNGAPHDPMNFILAGEHVYEIAASQNSQ